ncbi:hypothetical protein H6B51_05845 [Pseudoflavonifractor phocaeensis]|nr:hypothetical protein [Pseudoflavonifractor phocaeensis]
MSRAVRKVANMKFLHTGHLNLMLNDVFFLLRPEKRPNFGKPTERHHPELYCK